MPIGILRHGSSIWSGLSGSEYPLEGLSVIVYNETYEEEGTTYLRTSTGVGIPKVSGTGLDTVWDFSVLNDARFDKGSYVGNAYGLPEYYNFPYVDIYYDNTNATTRKYWKLTDFHYANIMSQSITLDNQFFLKALATTDTSNVITSVSNLLIYSTEQTGVNLSRLKTYIGIQADFYGDENLFQNSNFDTNTIWATQTGWDISGGFAFYDASAPSDVSILQDVGLEDNTIYKVGVEAFDYESSQLRIYIGNPNPGFYYTGTGVIERISMKIGDSAVYFRAKFNTPLKLDNAYCYKLYQNYYKS